MGREVGGLVEVKENVMGIKHRFPSSSYYLVRNFCSYICL